MEPAPASTRAATLLRRVGRALLAVEREQICCGEVTRHQFATLHLLESAGGLSTSDLAGRLRIDLSTASRNLAVLERAGCIRRRPAAADARRVHNQVTARGRACIDTLCCDERAAFASVFERVPRRERPAVLRALTLLAQALEGATDPACCGPDAIAGAAERGACTTAVSRKRIRRVARVRRGAPHKETVR